MNFNITCNSLKPLDVLLRDNLATLDIKFVMDKSGGLQLAEQLTADQKFKLSCAFERYGIQIIEDERETLVQQIKDTLFSVVYASKPLRKTLSSHLTEIFGYSYCHLNGIFSAATFSTIERYTILLKIERAKRMIIEDEQPFKEISRVLCYSSLGHLSKQFKKVTGITLTEFRNIIMKRKYGHKQSLE